MRGHEGMTVWVVCYGLRYEPYEILGVYGSQQAAEWASKRYREAAGEVWQEWLDQPWRWTCEERDESIWWTPYRVCEDGEGKGDPACQHMYG